MVTFPISVPAGAAISIEYSTDCSDMFSSATGATITPVASRVGNLMVSLASIGTYGTTAPVTGLAQLYVTIPSSSSIVGNVYLTSDATNSGGMAYGSTMTGGYFALGSAYYRPPPSAADQFRDRIRSQLQGTAKSRFLNIVKKNDPEGRARELLREMVDESDFRRYVTRGFLTVRGKTGLVYQIAYGMPIRCLAPGPNGKYREFESLCVIFKQPGLPPTDQVVMQKLMVQHDEFGLRSIANVSRMCNENDVVLGTEALAAIRKAAYEKKKKDNFVAMAVGNVGQFLAARAATAS
jgi:hypothetical protein